MEYVERHQWEPAVTFDGGELDCGNGLLLLIRKHIDPLRDGELLEIRSRESSVVEDLPAWCRMTKNDLVSCTHHAGEWSYLVSKRAFTPPTVPTAAALRSGTPEKGERAAMPLPADVKPVHIPARLPEIAPAPAIKPLSVMGIGSWPRPRWMLQALQARLEGRLVNAEFQHTADDAVRLCVAAQLRAGVDVVTDGEQRRDNYASFVGALLDNCQLIPITDLLPYVEDPAEFERELQSLDVPADSIRHPAVFGRLGRSQPLAVHEAQFLKTLTDKPRKVALPGPYLLTRTMWMECISDRAYATRESLAEDLVRVLREELFALLAAGTSLVQFDEPVLTEVVFAKSRGNRTFMCGALGAKRDPEHELRFAAELLNRVVAGVDPQRTALHVCRGNWSPDESVALHGDYRPLLPYLKSVEVGTLMLELCTPRAGELSVLAGLPDRLRIGLGVCNQKQTDIESHESMCAKAEQAIQLFGPQRILLNPDCGFATFADNPVSSSEIAEKKLNAIAAAAKTLRQLHRLSD